ncbi:pyridoxal-phosphate dependent enzyme [Nocardia sp. NEAU-351]|uniref:Pyridoxal-phosphate dependent enzyme n=2 Tax=Nocardia bovistercoris TaxID=2785916 RepID=A0A931N2N3_9NOCA|nr:pyridoxal-phosphate dependent enzyme [Nocardia bovistercoris]
MLSRLAAVAPDAVCAAWNRLERAGRVVSERGAVDSGADEFGATGRVTRTDVRAARRRVSGRVRETPVFHTSVAGPNGPVPVTLKLEYLQYGGTFKVRGSYNTLLGSAVVTERVVIASGGNAGIAAAVATARLGIGCTVVVPESAPHHKVAAMWSHGAEVLWHGATYTEAYRYAGELAVERGSTQLHAEDLPAVVAGAGAVALELEEQVRGRPPVLIAVGGGALVAGAAAALGSRQRVIGVEPVGLPAMHTALGLDPQAGAPRPDVLEVDRIGGVTLATARHHGVRSLLVSDDAVGVARDYLWREFRIVVEPTGATALAAIHSGAYVPPPGERPVVVLCSANTEVTAL